MFSPFAKLLCAITLASVALAQDLVIVDPSPGETVSARTPLTVTLQRPKPTTEVENVALVIGVVDCANGCPTDQAELGNVLYTGNFATQWTDSDGYQYENITLGQDLNWFNGPAQIKLANLYLSTISGITKLEFADTAVLVFGSTG